jgi:transcriptional regulator with XRE-family HTH domain
MPKLLEIQKPVPVERKVFAKNLKEIRQLAGLPLQELSAISTISYQYISDVERCVHNISMSYMSNLSHCLKTPLYALLNPNMHKAWDVDDTNAWPAYETLVLEAKPANLEQLLFGNNLRRYRKEAGLTQKEVDQLGNYKASMTSNIERYSVNITLDKMAPLTNILGVPLYKFFDPHS